MVEKYIWELKAFIIKMIMVMQLMPQKWQKKKGIVSQMKESVEKENEMYQGECDIDLKLGHTCEKLESWSV